MQAEEPESRRQSNTPDHPGIPLRPQSRLSLPGIVVNPDGNEYLIGNPELGIFVAIPEVGVVALDFLRQGMTIEQASEATSDRVGQDVNVLAFAHTLIQVGLGEELDEEREASRSRDEQGAIPLNSANASGVPRWISLFRPKQIKILFSWPMWSIYALTFVVSLDLLFTTPRLRPSFDDFLFSSSYTVSLFGGMVIGLALAAGHEAYHWLAAQAQGVGARFSVGRRFFLVTLETDLSQLLALPRRARLGPLLAGIAFDSVLLSLTLLVRLGSGSIYSLSDGMSSFLSLTELILVLRLALQPLLFLRTDLYAVMTTLVGSRNLYRVALLLTKGRLWRLSETEQDELNSAHPRDLRTARWFSYVYMIGLIWGVWMLWKFFIPGTLLLFGRMIPILIRSPLDSSAFWDSLAIALFALLQLGWPLVIYLKENRTKRDQFVNPRSS